MKNDMGLQTSSTEMVAISRAEYEALLAEKNELARKLDWLMEQVRLTKDLLIKVKPQIEENKNF